MDYLLRESYFQTALKKWIVGLSFISDFSLKDKKPLVYTQTQFSYFKTYQFLPRSGIIGISWNHIFFLCIYRIFCLASVK